MKRDNIFSHQENAKDLYTELPLNTNWYRFRTGNINSLRRLRV